MCMTGYLRSYGVRKDLLNGRDTHAASNENK